VRVLVGGFGFGRLTGVIDGTVVALGLSGIRVTSPPLGAFALLPPPPTLVGVTESRFSGITE
jgi:hypothetical protein